MSNAMLSASLWRSRSMPSPDTGTRTRARARGPLRDVLPWRHPCSSPGTSSQTNGPPRTNVHRLCLPNVSFFSARSGRRCFWLTETVFFEFFVATLTSSVFYSVGSLTCGKSRWGGEKKRIYWDLIALELSKCGRLSLKQKSCRISCCFQLFFYQSGVRN